MRMSEPSEPRVVRVSQGMGSVAQQVAEESDQELIEEPVAPLRIAAPSTGELTAQPRDELRPRMGGMLNVKIGALSNEVPGALAGLERRSSARRATRRLRIVRPRRRPQT